MWAMKFMEVTEEAGDGIQNRQIKKKKVNKTNINKSKIQIEQAKLTLNNTKTVLNQQVEQSYINLQNAQAQYDTIPDYAFWE